MNSGCLARLGVLAFVVFRPVSATTFAELEKAFNIAQTYVNEHRYRDAEEIIRRSMLHPQQSGAQELVQENSKLWALLGQITSETSSGSPERLLQAESYLAWAIHSSRCNVGYWHRYVEIRIRRQGANAFNTALKRHEPTRYVFPGTRWTIWQPGSDALLEALIAMSHGNKEQARRLLDNRLMQSHACPVGQLLAEVVSGTNYSSAFDMPTGDHVPIESVVAIPGVPKPPRQLEPHIRSALSEIEGGKYKEAFETVRRGSRGGWSQDASFTAFLTALLMMDAKKADEFYKILQGVDPQRASELSSKNAVAITDTLRTDRSTAEKKRIQDLLTSCATDHPDDPVVRTAAISFVEKVLKGGPAAATNLKTSIDQARRQREQEIATGARISNVERQLTLTKQQVERLNNEAMFLLHQYGVVEQLTQRITLDEEHLRSLDQRVDSAISLIEQHRTDLERMIRQQEARVADTIGRLATEMRLLNAELARQGQQLQYTTEQVSILENWRSQSPALVTTTFTQVAERSASGGKLSTFLRNLGDIVTVGIPLGPIQINILGLLSHVTEWFGL